jgi:hypothetical protein
VPVQDVGAARADGGDVDLVADPAVGEVGPVERRDELAVLGVGTGRQVVVRDVEPRQEVEGVGPVARARSRIERAVGLEEVDVDPLKFS